MLGMACGNENVAHHHVAGLVSWEFSAGWCI